jgi:GT2 family glycosyltransferase
MNDLVFIITLNWNGWEDTIACLESLLLLDNCNYRIVLLDNGSTNDSLKRLVAWASEKTCAAADQRGLSLIRYDRAVAETGGSEAEEAIMHTASAGPCLVLIDNKENLGFAAGCNVGMRYALARGAANVWLLNNDTVVAPNSLALLVQCLQSHSEFVGLTPQIRYFFEPNTIWNCGGNLTWYGSRRYRYNDAGDKEVPQSGLETITFVTGCAFLLRTTVIKKVGLLTEKFFMGEEDFDYSHRLKNAGFKIGCCFDALIYHKVSVSVRGRPSQGSLYIDFLNRFLYMKSIWPHYKWQLWRLGYTAYIFVLLRFRYQFKVKKILRMLQTVMHNSDTMEKVDRATYMDALKF